MKYFEKSFPGTVKTFYTLWERRAALGAWFIAFMVLFFPFMLTDLGFTDLSNPAVPHDAAWASLLWRLTIAIPVALAGVVTTLTAYIRHSHYMFGVPHVRNGLARGNFHMLACIAVVTAVVHHFAGGEPFVAAGVSALVFAGMVLWTSMSGMRWPRWIALAAAVAFIRPSLLVTAVNAGKLPFGIACVVAAVLLLATQFSRNQHRNQILAVEDAFRDDRKHRFLKTIFLGRGDAQIDAHPYYNRGTWGWIQAGIDARQGRGKWLQGKLFGSTWAAASCYVMNNPVMLLMFGMSTSSFGSLPEMILPVHRRTRAATSYAATLFENVTYAVLASILLALLLMLHPFPQFMAVNEGAMMFDPAFVLSFVIWMPVMQWYPAKPDWNNRITQARQGGGFRWAAVVMVIPFFALVGGTAFLYKHFHAAVPTGATIAIAAAAIIATQTTFFRMLQRVYMREDLV